MIMYSLFLILFVFFKKKFSIMIIKERKCIDVEKKLIIFLKVNKMFIYYVKLCIMYEYGFFGLRFYRIKMYCK